MKTVLEENPPGYCTEKAWNAYVAGVRCEMAEYWKKEKGENEKSEPPTKKYVKHTMKNGHTITLEVNDWKKDSE